MNDLLLILLFIFCGVALMVKLGERFSSPEDSASMMKYSRWIYPLVGLSLVLSLARYYWPD